MSWSVYNKRPGTSGIRGQLYESKLISLIFYRMKHDDRVEEFHLVTNVDKIGVFEDISFIVKLKGFDKPLAVFIQAKHKENDKRMLEIDLVKYFESYLKIRTIFKPNSGFVFSKSKFEETECFFVLYTTANDEFGDVLVESSFASILNKLIGTGGTAKQPYKNEVDVEFLRKSMKEEIISLAGQIAKFIYYNNDNFQLILNNEVVLRYNVILAQKVFDLSEIKPERHRIASVRQDFFDSNEELIILLKDTLYTEVLKNRKIGDTDIKTLLTKLLEESCNVKTLSKLIVTVIRYNNGRLEFLNKMSIEADFKRQLNGIDVSQATVNQAIELAAKEILSPLNFKVPIAFGNKDLTLSGTDVKVENRLNYLASKFFVLLENSKSSNNVVTIDDSLGNDFLQPNGGIAGAVGNILVADENKKLMKFTDNCDLLGNLSKRLFEKLRSGIYNLQEHKFCIKVKKFPKLSLDRREYEQNLAEDFLSKLLFYSSQADENEVEEILKTEIEEGQYNQPNNLQIRTDALCINFHDKIQKWWMKSKQAEYLTKESTIYEDAMNDTKAPLMRVINMMYKIKHDNYTFNEDALRSQKLQDRHLRTLIITESSALTATKVSQCLKNKEHIVLDLEYILNIPRNDRNALCSELTNTNEEKILIFVCDKIQKSKNEYKILEYYAKAVINKKIIVITNETSVDIINKYFVQPDNVVHDKRINLNDMSKESQEKILKSARVTFQGKEVGLDLILDDESLAFVEGEVLNKIISMETVVVGKAIGNSNYDEMKHLYVDRRVKETKNGIEIAIETLHDIVDDVVLVTATPGMGKSTLLTHLSVKTKEIDPKRWIVRIDLLKYSREFNIWRKNATAIDSLETVNFMCQLILREKFDQENKVAFVLEEANGYVRLKECTGDQETIFKLKLFLHFYNRENLIILLDGFDEICPDYTNEVIKFLETVRNSPRKHRMWVTSRPYNEVKSILQGVFWTSYEIEPLSPKDIEEYLEKFWKHNLILTEFDSKQLENVHNFIEFMLDSENFRLQSFELLVCYTYINAYHYLINEIKCTHLPPRTNYKDRNNQIANNNFRLNYNEYIKEHEFDVADNPLRIYLVAEYFVNEIKDADKNNKKWNVVINTFTFYERFIEKKLEKIRFQDKNKMDIYKPDVMMYYKKERADFFAMHKKLGAYAIFHRHSNVLFNTKELKDIRDTINLIKKGGEKTGLIERVADNIPIFEHMTFSEYFAVEYMCDLLKNENCSEKQKIWMEYIFDVMFNYTTYYFLNVQKMFGHKMQVDEALMSVLQQNEIVIFEMLMKQGKAHSEHCAKLREREREQMAGANSEYDEMQVERKPVWSLFRAVWTDMHDHVLFFISVIESCVNEMNLNDFLEYVCGSGLLTPIRSPGFDALIILVLNIVRKIDKSKLNSVVLDIYRFLPRSMNYDTMTSEEILELVHKHLGFLNLSDLSFKSMDPWYCGTFTDVAGSGIFLLSHSMRLTLRP